MHTTYPVSHRLVAYFLVTSLFLQSCYNPNRPDNRERSSFNPLQEELVEAPKTLTTMAVSQELAIQERVSSSKEKVYPTKEGQEVSFYQEGGKWMAQVSEKVGFLSRSLVLPVYFEGLDLEKQIQASNIHLVLPEKAHNQQGYVYVGKWGLMGGGNNSSTQSGNRKRGGVRISPDEEDPGRTSRQREEGQSVSSTRELQGTSLTTSQAPHQRGYEDEQTSTRTYEDESPTSPVQHPVSTLRATFRGMKSRGTETYAKA